DVRYDKLVDVDWLVKRGSHSADYHMLVLRMSEPMLLVWACSVRLMSESFSHCRHPRRVQFDIRPMGFCPGNGASLGLVQRQGRIALRRSASCDLSLAVERCKFGLGVLAGEHGGAVG